MDMFERERLTFTTLYFVGRSGRFLVEVVKSCVSDGVSGEVSEAKNRSSVACWLINRGSLVVNNWCLI